MLRYFEVDKSPSVSSRVQDVLRASVNASAVKKRLFTLRESAQQLICLLVNVIPVISIVVIEKTEKRPEITYFT